MKVFEIVTEHYPENSKEIRTQVEYAISNDDRLLTVAKWYQNHCYQYEFELKQVKEVLTISNQIDSFNIDETLL